MTHNTSSIIYCVRSLWDRNNDYSAEFTQVIAGVAHCNKASITGIHQVLRLHYLDYLWKEVHLPAQCKPVSIRNMQSCGLHQYWYLLVSDTSQSQLGDVDELPLQDYRTPDTGEQQLSHAEGRGNRDASNRLAQFDKTSLGVLAGSAIIQLPIWGIVDKIMLVYLLTHS